MKQAIISIVIIALSLIVWLHWGGLSNDYGTLIIALADTFILTAITDTEKSEEKAKE